MQLGHLFNVNVHGIIFNPRRKKSQNCYSCKVRKLSLTAFLWGFDFIYLLSRFNFIFEFWDFYYWLLSIRIYGHYFEIDYLNGYLLNSEDHETNQEWLTKYARQYYKGLYNGEGMLHCNLNMYQMKVMPSWTQLFKESVDKNSHVIPFSQKKLYQEKQYFAIKLVDYYK